MVLTYVSPWVKSIKNSCFNDLRLKVPGENGLGENQNLIISRASNVNKCTPRTHKAPRIQKQTHREITAADLNGQKSSFKAKVTRTSRAVIQNLYQNASLKTTLVINLAFLYFLSIVKFDVIFSEYKLEYILSWNITKNITIYTWNIILSNLFHINKGLCSLFNLPPVAYSGGTFDLPLLCKF